MQLAREVGARVIGTGRAADKDTALGLGADAFVDLQADKLEDVGEVDVVFDVIGGQILERSTALVRAGGRPHGRTGQYARDASAVSPTKKRSAQARTPERHSDTESSGTDARWLWGGPVSEITIWPPGGVIEVRRMGRRTHQPSIIKRWLLPDETWVKQPLGDKLWLSPANGALTLGRAIHRKTGQ